MDPLPFRLRVPGQDQVTTERISSTSFRFEGLAWLAGDRLHLEWTGTASVDEVAGLAVRQETIPLPAEWVDLPLARLRTIEFRGGWWRPRIELTGRDLGLLAPVPGEQLGRLRLWITRRDRHRARRLVQAVRQAALALPAEAGESGRYFPADTPAGGAAP